MKNNWSVVKEQHEGVLETDGRSHQEKVLNPTITGKYEEDNFEDLS